MVMPAVARPRATPARMAAREYRKRQGRVIASMITPALNSRIDAAPSAPSWPIRPTEKARPSWAEVIEASVSNAPVRAGEEPPGRGAAEVVMHLFDRAYSSASTCR